MEATEETTPKIEVPEEDTIKRSSYDSNPCRFLIAAQRFIDLVTQSNMFADKTIFIKDVLTSSNVFLLITRPRRWGKSLNLDMLKTFLEPSIDENGTISNTKNKAIFEGGSYAGEDELVAELKPLKIAQFRNEEFYKNSLGKFPVIFLDLSDEADTTWNYDAFRDSIKETYMKCDELYKFMLIRVIKSHNKAANPSEQVGCDFNDLEELEEVVFDKIRTNRDNLKTFRKYRTGDRDIDINSSISFLVNIMHTYYKRTVFVLIDEYDTVLNKHAGTPIYDAALSKLRAILRGLKGNYRVKKVVIVGITPIYLGTIFSGLNTYKADSVITGYFSEYFGLTTEEVHDLVIKTVSGNQEKSSEIENQLRSWYNGYQIGDLTIYNPWSIMSCLDECFSYPRKNPFKAYWVKTGSLSIIERMIKKVTFSKEINNLFTTGKLNHAITTCEDCNFLSIDGNEEIVNDFCKLLFHTGYLTIVDEDSYKIPNKEIINCYRDELLPRWIQAKYEHGFNMNELINQLAVNIEDKKKYFDCIQNGFLDLLTEKDKSSKNENDFQEIMAAPSRIFQIVSNKAKHIIRSEVSTQMGMRADHIFFPIKSQSETGIIHEYKQADTPSKKNDLLIEALWQIFAKLYLEPLVNDTQADELTGIIKDIIVRGIVFFLSSNGSGWVIDYIECKMDINSARALIEIFSSSPYNNNLANQSITEGERILSRKAFLGANSCEFFYQLLERYSAIHADQLAKFETIEKEYEKKLTEKEIMQKEKEMKRKEKETITKYFKSDDDDDDDEAKRKPTVKQSGKQLRRLRKKRF